MAQGNEGFMDRAMSAWWGKVVCGLIIVGFAILFYVRINNFEAGESETMRVSRMEKVLYDIGGKWAVTGAGVVFGGAIAAWGVAQLVRGKE